MFEEYKKFEYHFDLNHSDPEMALLFMLVDDNKMNFKRRNNICSTTFKRIAVSYKVVTKNFYSFYNFCG